MLFLRATEHMTFSWQSSWWWKYLKILFPAMVWIHMSLISCDEGIHIQWDEGQIMKVIYFKKQPKNSKFYWLISFTKPHKSHEKEIIYPIALSSNISSHEDETESSLFLICNWKKNQTFYMLSQYKQDKISIRPLRKTDLCYLQSLPRYASKSWWNH